MKQPKKQTVERFPGVSLKEDERRALVAMRAGRKRLSIRRWRRIRTLELLDKGWTMQDTADATGTFPREVRRVGRRYLQRGLEVALSEDPRPKPFPKFDARSEAAVVAIACSPPPPGRSRWSGVLLAREVERRGIVASVGKETIRRLLSRHELKPWREKMWCVPELNREYVERMEDVLNLMEKAATVKEPVVALDERPVQLHATERMGRPMAPGRVAQRDYEYVRRGTANIFCIVAPKTGRHLTHATTNRTARRFASAMKRVSDAYPDATRIHIILDNLNIHRLKSLTDAYGEMEGRRLWRRFVIHHTPQHGSWLNPAEIEVSVWSRECMGRDRIATLCELQYRTRLWNKAADRARRKINWRFTTADARRTFRYRRGTTPGAKD